MPRRISDCLGALERTGRVHPKKKTQSESLTSKHGKSDLISKRTGPGGLSQEEILRMQMTGVLSLLLLTVAQRLRPHATRN